MAIIKFKGDDYENGKRRWRINNYCRPCGSVCQSFIGTQDTAGGFIGSVVLAAAGIKLGLEFADAAEQRYPRFFTDKNNRMTFWGANSPFIVACVMGLLGDVTGDAIEHYITREQEGGIKVLQIETAPSALPASVIVPA